MANKVVEPSVIEPDVIQYIAGTDEAGRGPLAGPVVVAAVILDPRRPIAGLADSKVLTEKRRDALAAQIRDCALAWSIIHVEADEIDRINILQASLAGMSRALRALSPTPTLALIDGNRLPKDLPCTARAIVNGDASEPAISAASILAKTERDGLLVRLHDHYPQYGFAQHKGYPTAAHLRALREHGPSPQHRRSFAPVRDSLIHQSTLALA